MKDAEWIANLFMGVSSRSMLKSLSEGVQDPNLLAQFAKGKMKNKKKELIRALNGLMGPHQKMLLASQLRHIKFLEKEIAHLDQEISR